MDLKAAMQIVLEAKKAHMAGSTLHLANAVLVGKDIFAILAEHGIEKLMGLAVRSDPDLKPKEAVAIYEADLEPAIYLQPKSSTKGSQHYIYGAGAWPEATLDDGVVPVPFTSAANATDNWYGYWCRRCESWVRRSHVQHAKTGWWHTACGSPASQFLVTARDGKKALSLREGKVAIVQGFPPRGFDDEIGSGQTSSDTALEEAPGERLIVLDKEK